MESKFVHKVELSEIKLMQIKWKLPNRLGGGLTQLPLLKAKLLKTGVSNTRSNQQTSEYRSTEQGFFFSLSLWPWSSSVPVCNRSIIKGIITPLISAAHIPRFNSILSSQRFLSLTPLICDITYTSILFYGARENNNVALRWSDDNIMHPCLAHPSSLILFHVPFAVLRPGSRSVHNGASCLWRGIFNDADSLLFIERKKTMAAPLACPATLMPPDKEGLSPPWSSGCRRALTSSPTAG